MHHEMRGCWCVIFEDGAFWGEFRPFLFRLFPGGGFFFLFCSFLFSGFVFCKLLLILIVCFDLIRILSGGVEFWRSRK
jgi:hypothetical protein